MRILNEIYGEKNKREELKKKTIMDKEINIIKLKKIEKKAFDIEENS